MLKYLSIKLLSVFLIGSPICFTGLGIKTYYEEYNLGVYNNKLINQNSINKQS